MKKLLLIILLSIFLAPLTAQAISPAFLHQIAGGVMWDLLNEDCVDISDWVDSDTANGTSEVSPAGQFRMDANGHASNNQAKRIQDIGSFPNTFTAEIKVYHDNVGTSANTDYFYIACKQSDEKIFMKFCEDGLIVSDTGGNTNVGALIKEAGSAEWQTWRFLVTFTGVTGDGTCDVFLDDSTHNWEQVGNDVPCSTEGAGTDGETIVNQLGYTTDDMLTHIDYIKIAMGLYIP